MNDKLYKNFHRKIGLFLLLISFLASCSGGGGGNTTTPPTTFDFICPDGTKADGTTTTANTEKCTACNTGFTLSSDKCVASANATCHGSPEARAATADEMLDSQGRRQGLQITRDSNGNVERECTYRDDREHGICTIYDSNCFFILRASYENGVFHGPFANYDGNGNSDSNRSTYGMYNKGKQVGEWHIRNFAGLETVGFYDQEGLRTGIWTTLRPDGGSEPLKTERWKTELDSMGLKRNGPCNHPAGNKDGVWTTFNADGSVNKRETWVDGVLMAK